jgi:GDP/UDP-N,N'-diacetylbacillosamine 2-epimerase (hydrolysing)
LKRKICVVTGTRAEYGLLYWVIKTLSGSPDFELQLIVTGMHLSSEFGLTFKQIEDDGFKIDKKIEILLSSDSEVGISKSIGLGIISFAEAYEDLKPDLVFILGDRFEILASATAAMIAKIPIAHCHGGEATEGLIDESIRHSITKMSHIHFVSTEEYRKRVIQLGEQPERVFKVGALGIENINRLKLLDKNSFQKSINFKLGKRNVLITFHPVTLENKSAVIQFNELLLALKELKNTKLFFTKPNADTDGRVIIKMIDDFVSLDTINRVSFISLGQLRYLSALQFMDVVLGNSSSGLIEVPTFKKPTINIGDRQRGRIIGASIVNCEPDKDSITLALKKVFSHSFKDSIKSVTNPYGSENSSEKILTILTKFDFKSLLKKAFYNIS